jgi:UDP-glucose 4-epimerase
LTAALRDAGVSVAEYTRDRLPIAEDGVLAHGVAAADTVFYMASSVNPKVAQERPDLVRRDSDAFARLVAALSGLARPVKVVLPSSGGTVYDPMARPPYDETSALATSGSYALSRLQLEEILFDAGGAVQPAVCRISNAYGPGQRIGTGQGVIAHWLDAVVAGRPLRLFGDPRSVRDYIYVDDVVDALIAVGWSDAAPPTLNVGSGVPTSLGDLADHLVRVIGHESVNVEYEDARSFDRRDSWLDCSLIEKTLGWRATVALPDGLRGAWMSAKARRTGSP